MCGFIEIVTSYEILFGIWYEGHSLLSSDTEALLREALHKVLKPQEAKAGGLKV